MNTQKEISELVKTLCKTKFNVDIVEKVDGEDCPIPIRGKITHCNKEVYTMKDQDGEEIVDLRLDGISSIQVDWFNTD